MGEFEGEIFIKKIFFGIINKFKIHIIKVMFKEKFKFVDWVIMNGNKFIILLINIKINKFNSRILKNFKFLKFKFKIIFIIK